MFDLLGTLPIYVYIPTYQNSISNIPLFTKFSATQSKHKNTTNPKQLHKYLYPQERSYDLLSSSNSQSKDTIQWNKNQIKSCQSNLKQNKHSP